MDLAAFHSISYGLYVVSSVNDEGRKCGCVVNTFQQVTNEPLQVSVALNKENVTLAAVLESGRYCVTVLDQETPLELIGVFGFRNSIETDKFADAAFEVDAAGLPLLLEHGVAAFCCSVVGTVDMGTHLVVFGQVDDAKVLGKAEPLTYAYYHAVKRGKTPPKASSYIADEAQGASGALADDAETTVAKCGWRCTVCGYIVEGYPDGLPEDFRCPVCGVGPEMFERITL
ncbi:flavin reductase [Parvibacter caecicola]|nr:flavin reductase [Parvibacter caecicola]MBB3170468.1 flavin reductase (DIM6/NTAB) family NADH-FMN oxidoreductase RutF/rubredoxin [Parvibacter caecicola]